ncbi:Vacuolar basic amino acid transporter 1 [Paramyrothecium foliicola]|nr:Vacuolar basic amino acid transporter 1 [Paramyrothecium foliicola]
MALAIVCRTTSHDPAFCLTTISRFLGHSDQRDPILGYPSLCCTMASDAGVPETAGQAAGSTEASPLLPGAGAPADAAVETPQIVLSRIRGLAVALSLWPMILLLAVNFSGMAMVQGAIAEDLGARMNPMWLSTAFFIPVSALAPFVGRLATIFPSRALLLPISALISIGCFISAFAQNVSVFMTGRVVSGVGSAGIMSLLIVFVLEMTTGKTRGIMLGFVNAGMTLGVSVGAILYGALLPAVGWRPLFWAQTPVALIAGLGAYLSIPTSADAVKSDSETLVQKLKKIDYLGACLLTTTIVLFLVGLADDIKPLFLFLSLLSLIVFVAVEKYVAEDRIIPLDVLFSRGALLSCLSQLGLMIARWTVLFYTPIFMLAVRGAAPAAAGSILLPTNFGFGLGGVLVGWVHVRRAGAYWLPSIISAAAFSVTVFWLSFASTPNVSTYMFVAVVFANGLALGAAFNYTVVHLLHLTSGKEAQYVATSLIATFRNLGGSFGTAIGGGIFYRLLRAKLTDTFLAHDGGLELTPARQRLVSRLLASPDLVFHGSLSPEAQKVAVESYAGAMCGLWQAAAILALSMVVVQALTGWGGSESKPFEADEDEGLRE